LTVLDNVDGWKSVDLMTTADGDSPDKLQGRSHQSPVYLTSLVTAGEYERNGNILNMCFKFITKILTFAIWFR